MDSIGASHTNYAQGNSSPATEIGEIRPKISESSRESLTETVKQTIASNEFEVSTLEARPISTYHISKTYDEATSEIFWNTLSREPRDFTKILNLTPQQITSLLNHSDMCIRFGFSHYCLSLNENIPEQLEQLFHQKKDMFDAIFCETLFSNIGLQDIRLIDLPRIFKHHNPWIYNKIIEVNPFQYRYIPEPLRDEEVFFQSILTHKTYGLIRLIKSPERVMKLMIYPGAEIYFFFVPEFIRKNQQWLEQAIANNPLIGASRILDNNGLLIRGITDWLIVLQNNNISTDDKKQIISHIKQYVLSEKVESLFNDDINPISSFSENPFVEGMVYRSLIARSPRPTSFGNTLIGESQELAKIRQMESIQNLPDEIKSRLINTRSIQTGGRNIILSDPTTDTATVIKLNRRQDQKNDKKNLFLESAISEKLRQSEVLKLKSAIPKPLGIFQINVDDIPPEVLENLHDKPHIVDNQITAYIYAAPASYCRYAHTSSSESGQEECIKGIEYALRDAALLLRHGLAYTSCLPAFHDTEQNRKWNAFYPLFTDIIIYPRNNDFLTQRKLPGTFGAWNGTATERPDYRHSGLSDWADFERVGEIFSYFDEDQINTYESAQQNLAVANTLFNHILAAVLLYARANGENKEYHWQCEYEKARATKFINNALSYFLEGYMGETQSIAHFLGISNETYHRWLARTATELLYWTANRNNAPHSFAKDIENHGRLNDQLYSNTSITPKVTGSRFDTSYPESMTNLNGEQNLGWHSQHFPLTGLTQLLTLFAGKVVMIRSDI